MATEGDERVVAAVRRGHVGRLGAAFPWGFLPGLPGDSSRYSWTLSRGRSSLGRRFSQDLLEDWVRASFTQVK